MQAITVPQGQLMPYVLVRDRIKGCQRKKRLPGREAKVSIRLRESDLKTLQSAQRQTLSHSLRAVIEAYGELEREGKASTHYGDPWRNLEDVNRTKKDFWLRGNDLEIVNRVIKTRACTSTSEALRLIIEDYSAHERTASAKKRKDAAAPASQRK